MSEKKTPKKITPRAVSFFVGVTICLFSVILIMNVGGPARLFALPFFYAFGLVSYVVYLLMYALGLSFLFRGKGVKIRFNSRLFGSVILFITLTMIATLIQCKSSLPTSSFVSDYNHLVFDNRVIEREGYASINYLGYWKESFINMFGLSPFGGGILGYFIISLFPAKMKASLGWGLAVVAAILGLLLIFLKNILALVKKYKEKHPKKEKKEQPSSINISSSYRSNEREVIRNASVINEGSPSDVRSMGVSSISHQPVDYNQRVNVSPVNNPYVSTNIYGGDGTFVPARFIRRNNNPMETSAQPVVQTPIIEQTPKTPEQALIEANNESTRFEQMQLNFDEKQQLNEELLTAQPEFAPVENKPKPVEMVAPQPIPQNIAPTTVQPIKKPRVKWIPPSTALLEELETAEAADKNNAVAEERKMMINQTFESYGVRATCVDYVVGPSVTNFRIQYESNVRTKDVENLVQDISRNLGGIPARFQKTVRGTTYSGIEVSNAVITPVSFKEVFLALPDPKKKPLEVAFGKCIDGTISHASISEFPHALVSGTTGSGKSVFVQSLICTLIMRNSPDDLKLVLVDPKMVEMAAYRDIPHLLCPVISDMKKAKVMIDKLVKEMNDRYSIFEENLVRSISEYNELAEEEGKDKMPYIVMFIDEYADLIQTYKEVATPVVQIAQKARACGIHMFIATQRPSTDVVSGVIKGNLPTRIALKMANATDSITIVGEGGAEKLLGKGDMLIQAAILGPELYRMQSCFIQNKEIRHIIGYLKEHYPVDYDPRFLNLVEEAEQSGKEMVEGPAFNGNSSEDDEEAKYKSVKEWVMQQKYMSMSKIQRDCSVGFNRAGRFFKRLQDEGVIATETEGNKGCPVLLNDDFYDNDDNNVVTSAEQSSF